jgi:hypothetical protein
MANERNLCSARFGLPVPLKDATATSKPNARLCKNQTFLDIAAGFAKIFVLLNKQQPGASAKVLTPAQWG